MSALSTLAGVLMVGHSLISPTQPQMLQQLLAARDIAATVDAQNINGAPLIWNWSHGDTAEGVDARAALETGVYDTLILTEAVPLTNHLKWSDTPEHVAGYAAPARIHDPDARVFLLETWHSLDSGTGVAVENDAGADVPWRRRIDDDLPLWQGILTDAEIDAALIPAGQAMGALSDAIDAGRVPGLDAIADVFADDIHPNALGHYFVTLVTFAVITGQDPVGLPFRLNDPWGAPLPAPDAVTAEAMQRIAGRVVADATERRLSAAPTTRAPPEPIAPTPRPRDRAPAASAWGCRPSPTGACSNPSST